MRCLFVHVFANPILEREKLAGAIGSRKRVERMGEVKFCSRFE